MSTTSEHPAEATAEFQAAPFRLQFAAASDIGLTRRDNQDSGYAGPWLLAVCDGVGGAARGDLASAAAITELQVLDSRPSGDPLIEVQAALLRAQDRLAAMVDLEPALNGTSTTAVVAHFDGEQLSFGHVGDSRAYLLRGEELRQLTRDHTFVQSLIDEGRLSEEGARSHPNRNLILKALDGIHDTDPDLFRLHLSIGDRVLICSDGASGVLGEKHLGELLAQGTPLEAAHRLIQASLTAGSTDNVTCVVADIVDAELADLQAPMVVGAAANQPPDPVSPTESISPTGSGGHRRGASQWLSGQRGAVPPASTGRGLPIARTTDPAADHAVAADPEMARYAPRPPRRFLGLRRILVGTMALGVGWVASAAAWSWSQQQYFVGEHAGQVTIFRGVDADLPVLTLSHPYETTDVAINRLADFDAQEVRAGIPAADLADARRTVDDLAAQQAPPPTSSSPEPPTPTSSSSPSSSP
ncbi:MAG: PP2C family protein-serine/threonine phosphatase [Nocardioides sp.]